MKVRTSPRPGRRSSMTRRARRCTHFTTLFSAKLRPPVNHLHPAHPNPPPRCSRPYDGLPRRAQVVDAGSVVRRHSRRAQGLIPTHEGVHQDLGRWVSTTARRAAPTLLTALTTALRPAQATQRRLAGLALRRPRTQQRAHHLRCCAPHRARAAGDDPCHHERGPAGLNRAGPGSRRSACRPRSSFSRLKSG